MKRRLAVGLAWSAFGLSLVLGGAGNLLLVLAPRERLPGPPGSLSVAPTLAFLTYALVGALIAARRPANPIGWICCAIGLSWEVIPFARGYVTHALSAAPPWPAVEAVAWLPNIWIAPSGLVALLVLLFPDGRLPSARWRPAAWLVPVYVVTLLLTAALTPGRISVAFPSLRNPLGIEGASEALAVVSQAANLALLLSYLLGVLGLVVRFRRATTEVRLQLKWFAFAGAFFVVVLTLLGLAFFWPGLQAVRALDPTARIPEALFVGIPYALGEAALPAAVAMAVLKYRLYDIDLLINRTLVYGGLTACIVGVYVLVVGYVGALFQVHGDAVALLAAGVVAVVFQPLRERLQRGVNRLLYGQRDEPYAVLSQLGQRLEATLAPDAVLPSIVQTVHDALKLPYAAIAVPDEQGSRVAAAPGDAPDTPLRLPLVYQRETVGELHLAPRARGESFSAADRRLLDDVARQAGIAVHAVRLTADLQHSRQRLVTAREEERRRLRRDLHDGLGPELASMTLQAEAARDCLRAAPGRTDALLAELIGQLQAATAEIRRLVYELRPPALDDLGLVAALRTLAARYDQGSPPGLRITVEAPDVPSPLPAAVEVAAYRICQEALTNVVRHAGARHCTLQLVLAEADGRSGTLVVEIRDDGRGLAADRRAGVGLASMRERAAELGGTCLIEPVPTGGTRVLARLPLPALGQSVAAEPLPGLAVGVQGAA